MISIGVNGRLVGVLVKVNPSFPVDSFYTLGIIRELERVGGVAVRGVGRVVHANDNSFSFFFVARRCLLLPPRVCHSMNLSVLAVLLLLAPKKWHRCEDEIGWDEDGTGRLC